MDLSNEAINYVEGIPLALEVLGSFLFGKIESKWRSVMIKLKKISHDNIVRKLNINFDALNNE